MKTLEKYLLDAAQELNRIMFLRVYGDIDMPSKSPKQARTMRAAEHNPAFRKKMHIPLKVAKEFNRADARKGKRK